MYIYIYISLLSRESKELTIVHIPEIRHVTTVTSSQISRSVGCLPSQLRSCFRVASKSPPADHLPLLFGDAQGFLLQIFKSTLDWLT